MNRKKNNFCSCNSTQTNCKNDLKRYNTVIYKISLNSKPLVFRKAEYSFHPMLISWPVIVVEVDNWAYQSNHRSDMRKAEDE